MHQLWRLFSRAYVPILAPIAEPVLIEEQWGDRKGKPVLRVHATNVKVRSGKRKLYTIQHDLAKAYNKMCPRLAMAMWPMLRELGAVLEVLAHYYHHLSVHNRLGVGLIGAPYSLWTRWR
eukprot:5067158-Amphidinium_carterae.1